MDPKKPFLEGSTVRRISNPLDTPEHFLPIGSEYIVERYDDTVYGNSANMVLKGSTRRWGPKRFELVEAPVEATPEEMFAALQEFFQGILREPPIRVGDIYEHTASALQREVLALFGTHAWVVRPDQDDGPFTIRQQHLLDNFKRVKIGPFQ